MAQARDTITILYGRLLYTSGDDWRHIIKWYCMDYGGNSQLFGWNLKLLPKMSMPIMKWMKDALKEHNGKLSLRTLTENVFWVRDLRIFREITAFFKKCRFFSLEKVWNFSFPLFWKIRVISWMEVFKTCIVRNTLRKFKRTKWSKKKSLP